MANSLQHWCTGKWWELRGRYWHQPIWLRVYIWILGLFGRNLKAQLVQKDTDVVIECFPRPANSYLLHALKLATNNKTKIAHHNHDPCEVARAGRIGIPCFIFLRDPLEVATSWKIKAAFLDSGSILRIYLTFHRFVSQFEFTDTYIRLTDVLNLAPQVVGNIVHYVSETIPVNLDLVIDSAIFNMVDQRKSKRGDVNTLDFDFAVDRPSRSKDLIKQEVGTELALNECCSIEGGTSTILCTATKVRRRIASDIVS